MANNPYVNKVEYGGQTLIDLTGDTVTPETLALGVTAHAADGSVIVGTMSILDAYPVGSIYMSVVSTDPGTIFGGTWVTFGAGRVLVGVDANDADFDTVEETGGEKTHILTTSEMASHTHGNKSITGTMTPLCWSSNGGSGIVSVTNRNANKKDPGSGSAFGGTTLSINASHEHDSVGSNQAHNNLQPYITCYMWKRTA